MRREPVKGQLYRHFKGNVYEIVAVALHTETDEFLVIYQNVDDHNRIYARPVDMFLSEVDHEKYPDIKEKYRFTLIEDDRNCIKAAESGSKSNVTNAAEKADDSATNNDAQDTYDNDMKVGESASELSEECEGRINPLLEQLLDADSFEDKLDIFYKMRNTEDITMLRNVAVSLDIETTRDEADELYDEILGCLKMMTKYECNRLRRR